jgi:hypothetical protein
MTSDEANKIFKHWKEHVEVSNKMAQIFTGIPESFLPYPMEVLEEALNIVAKEYFDDGDKKASKNIQGTIGYLARYEKDETALESMKRCLDFYLSNPELRKIKLEQLQRCRDSWAEQKQRE